MIDINYDFWDSNCIKCKSEIKLFFDNDQLDYCPIYNMLSMNFEGTNKYRGIESNHFIMPTIFTGDDPTEQCKCFSYKKRKI